jgi:hypothetical protein
VIKKSSALAAAGLTMLGLGAFTGSVIGADDAADRLAPALADPVDQVAGLERAATEARTAGRKRKVKKPTVLHGRGEPLEIAAGETSAVSLRCPGRHVPVSAGHDADVGGIYAGAVLRDTKKRSMLVVVTNTGSEDGRWAATIACMKGVKEG